MKKSVILTRLLPLLGIILLIVLIAKIGTGSILSSFAEISYDYLLYALLLVIPVAVLQAFKWFVIVRKQRIKLSFSEALKIHLIGIFYGFVTPVRIGNFIRIVYLKKKTGSTGKSASSVVLDRAMDLCAVLFLATIGAFLIAAHISGVLIWFAAVWLLFLIGGFMLFNESAGRFVLKMIYKRVVGTSEKKVDESFHEFYHALPSVPFLALIFLLNMASWVLVYTQVFIVGQALGAGIPYQLALTVIPISTIIALVPISIAGLGTREASLVTLLGLFGIGAAKIISTSLLSVLIASLIPAAIGMLLSFRMPVQEKGKGKT